MLRAIARRTQRTNVTLLCFAASDTVTTPRRASSCSCDDTAIIHNPVQYKQLTPAAAGPAEPENILESIVRTVVQTVVWQCRSRRSTNTSVTCRGNDEVHHAGSSYTEYHTRPAMSVSDCTVASSAYRECVERPRHDASCVMAQACRSRRPGWVMVLVARLRCAACAQLTWPYMCSRARARTVSHDVYSVYRACLAQDCGAYAARTLLRRGVPATLPAEHDLTDFVAATPVARHCQRWQRSLQHGC
jgi:hypothetical protein